MATLNELLSEELDRTRNLICAFRAIRFDLDGNAFEILPGAHRPADAYIAIRGRPIPPDTLRAIMRVE